LKFLSSDRKEILKSEGLGRFGAQTQQRAKCISQAGFGPAVRDAGNGLSAYTFVSGKPLIHTATSTEIIEHIAEYCAYRRSKFRYGGSVMDDLREMVRFNTSQELGIELEISSETFYPTSAVICDGKMHPHEWIATTESKFFKVDACSHGDDHLFPGPTDIGWDLAGAIVEWDMHKDGANFLLSCYARRSGDNPMSRIGGYLIAYSAFRLAYCKMALTATRGTDEETRLQQAYNYYRGRLLRHLADGGYARHMLETRLCGSSA
jgi:hypothetical protein